MLRTHTCGELGKKEIDNIVTLSGWCQSNRDHGGIIFIDLRDRYGITQVVFDPKENKSVHKIAEKIRREDVIQVKGKVRSRGKGLVNEKIPTGHIEVLVTEMNVLNKADVPPIEVDDRKEASEETRLKYRYLDLRRPIMQKRMILRHNAAMATREYLSSQDFLEIETPILMKSTPEGARDYVVPSRVNPGNFYALPQSPQLYKQILMVSGFDRYFQMARCLRDEDLRQDRQPEFTQIDIEMSFVEQEDIFKLGENLIAYIFKKALGKKVPIPFPVLNFDDAMEKYGCDKPDLRFDLELKNVSDIVKKSDFNVFKSIVEKGGIVKCIAPKKDFSRKELDEYISFCQKFGAKGMSWMKVQNNSLESNLAKFFSPKLQKSLIEKTGAEEGSTLMFIAGKPKLVNDVLSRLRNKLGKDLKLYNPKEFKFCWVADFPLFEWDDEDESYAPAHHMFTMPKKEQIKYLTSDPGKVKADCYDMVLNGVELASGSIRIWDPDIQKKVMKVVGFPEEKAKQRFGFLLEAFKYGAPPHGGFAIGFDRLVAMMNGIMDIREVIAFPKNKNAQCPMDESPSEISTQQLKELHLKLDFVKKKSEKKDDKVFLQIREMLVKNQVKFDHLEHEPVYTSEQAAKVRKTKLRQAAKALIFKTDKGFVQGVVAGDHEIDVKKLKEVSGAKKLRLAKPEEVKKATGLTIGSIPPFGNLFKMKVFVDPSLSKSQIIVFNAGSHTDSIKMGYGDWKRIVEPSVENFSK